MQHNLEQHGSDAVPIMVWGMDADGVIFRQSVNARDITEYGALLEGLPRRLNLGDFVGVPFAKGTALEIRMWLGSGKLLTKGIVRTSVPSLGMGIEFIDMTPAEVDLLGKFLKSHVASPN
jgi:hypothetical protein